MRFAQGAVPRNIVIVSVDTWGDVLKGFFRVSKHECNGTESFPDRFGFREMGHIKFREIFLE